MDFAGFGYLFNEFASFGFSEGSNGRQLTSETVEETSLVEITATSEGGLKVKASEEVTDATVNWLKSFAMNNKCDKDHVLEEVNFFGGLIEVCITFPVLGHTCF